MYHNSLKTIRHRTLCVFFPSYRQTDLRLPVCDVVHSYSTENYNLPLKTSLSPKLTYT